MRNVLYGLVAIACGGLSDARACPPVALSQSVAAPLAVAIPQAFAAQTQIVTVAPVAQAVAGFSVAMPTAAAAIPVSVAQPVAFAASPLVAAQFVGASGACSAVRVRGGAVCGGRARLLPRQRSVARTVVR